MKKTCVVFLFAMLCTACSSEKAGLRELKRLCEKDAGLRIYKTVEADGYYDATGGFDLVQSPYRFYEFCDGSPFKSSVIPEPGCYRVEKVGRETGQCHQAYDEALWNNSFARGYSEFREKNCIAVEKIDQPTARYSYHNGIKFWPAKNGFSEFGRSYVEIRVRESGELLSEYISYSYNPRPKFTTPIDCPNINKEMPSFLEANLVQQTIKTYKEK